MPALKSSPELLRTLSFWTNPVVVRDMRVRMRGSRAFWNQGIYLAILSLIAVVGYASSTSLENMGGEIDPVAIQMSLQMFYSWIFEGLALLIAIIAPALTAMAVISERKLQTLDLLITTPMTAMQMLSGKLISSIAFILLLLALSIPASALCIILGGSTIENVLQTYALLAIDGILIAAIGLAESSSATQYIQSIATTYGAIVVISVLTYIGAASSGRFLASSMMSHGHVAAPFYVVLLELNPFIAVVMPDLQLSLPGFTIPGWLGAALVGAVLIRIIMTAAALRVGMYGSGLVGSLRRQILFASFAGSFLASQALRDMSSPEPQSIIILCSTIFALSVFLFAPIFVPRVNEDGPPGQTVSGAYDLRRAYSADYSGALPFYHFWLLMIVGGALVGVTAPSSTATGAPAYGGVFTSASTDWINAVLGGLTAFIYLSGAGFLYWSLARRTAWLTSFAGAARSLCFLLFATIVMAPGMIMGIQEQIVGADYNAFNDSPVRFAWVLFPFQMNLSRGPDVLSPLIWFVAYAALQYAAGILIYPPWKAVTPGGCSPLFTAHKPSVKKA